MRLSREKKTISKMIKIYCSDNHFRDMGLCADCTRLQEYAHKKIDLCRFGRRKPVCSKCPLHCYNEDMRDRVRAVMRYSGPRMIFRHPLHALFHLLYSKRKTR